jgi:hypothetical protein
MKNTLKFMAGLSMICFVAIVSCKKDSAPAVSVEVGNIQSTVDSGDCKFAITLVNKEKIRDTVTIKMFGYNADSSKKIVINFYKVVGFKTQEYTCGEDLYSGTSISVDYFSGTDHYSCDGVYGTGTIKVLTYNTEGVAGSFDLNAGKLYDTSRVVKLKGEFNAVFDVNSLIPDIDVPLGTMVAKINNNLKYFSVVAAKISFNGTDSTVNVTGTVKGSDESIVLQFVNLNPTSGQAFNLERGVDMQYAYIKGSYVLDSLSTFVTNGADSSTYARFSIVKIARTYVQGKFEFVAKKTTEPYNLVSITGGKFNSVINVNYDK